ncbi:aminotransferase class I/II-fold pyridoxal phosphate-dependent enzyme [Testudinibacter sp. TR-2022]|uniref:aminotransferase class I/II-fold pyridoxal phosphate-dependent enzyme n=1 Tax=Testudinibacter sp. TR-2022 TaxID=2585029 RepID=UPI00111AC9DE|nr:aminotransferase class I/II-fold pyridoxal phosphate-dependent enzyme [Testudinibacter sp. TR-2022]TNH05773.1 aminotransferase class I/II-fold pyridoxal phosphate-dependent enzyme [Pasteurellaceae bacterium Phil11]TNH22218.1 aminotransferase class I/II-fold pyridoxal phosphate-dependent enzyme [Testudinibacter sp. TR-2022]TNH25817.1 aminotransferase class I/II-fold pyridoxal phosphate-dependent enzyme [Testudinibacter sp. TR-2022]
MKTFPLQSLTLSQAMQKQFELVAAITRHFTDGEFLLGADLGLKCGFNQPKTTFLVENAIADFFQAEAAVLVQGAGSGAIREGLAALLKANQRILIHTAPIYPTTKTTFELMGLEVVQADFNQVAQFQRALAHFQPQAILIQHTRQQPQDSFDLAQILTCCQEKNIPTLVDDNYAVMKVMNIGCEAGATLSAFSSFKLFGPEGVGIVVGDATAISKIRQSHYSGGCQIQGHLAMEVLRGLVLAPVMQAVQAQVNDELVERLNNGAVPQVKSAFLANAQSKVLIVEFFDDIAEQVLQTAPRFGALPYPVGAESKYEVPPLFYRVSGTFRQSDPGLEKRTIRINPNRAGAETVLTILKQSLSALSS